MTPEQKKRAREEGGDITKLTPRQMKRLEKIAKEQKEEREKKKGVRMKDIKTPRKRKRLSMAEKEMDEDRQFASQGDRNKSSFVRFRNLQKESGAARAIKLGGISKKEVDDIMAEVATNKATLIKNKRKRK